MLYRASRDGWETQSFHSRCDDHKYTLVIVKTVRGYIFGGYTDRTWAGNAIWKLSNKSFLFSLRSHAHLPPTKMKVKSGGEGCAIYAFPAFGPVFGGGCDFYIGRGDHNMKYGYTCLNKTYELPSGASEDFLTGKTGWENMFELAETEVFEV